MDRRSEGKYEPQDPQTLATLDADLEGLRGLIARTVAGMPPALDMGPVTAAEAAWGAIQVEVKECHASTGGPPRGCRDLGRRVAKGHGRGW